MDAEEAYVMGFMKSTFAGTDFHGMGGGLVEMFVAAGWVGEVG